MKNRPILERLIELGLISQLDTPAILEPGEKFAWETTFNMSPVITSRALEHLKDTLIKKGSAQEVILFGYNKYKESGQTKHIIGRQMLSHDNIEALLFVLQQEFAEKKVNAIRIYIIDKIK